MKKTNIIFIIVVVLILFVDIGYYFFHPKTLPKITLFINSTQFSVEIAQTNEEQAAGLGNRDELDKNSGMLFVFEKPSRQLFCMKDMKFPIDIVWIDSNKKVVGFKENAKPEDFPEAYPSPRDVIYVLEIGSGEVKNHNIKINDQAIFDLATAQK